MDKKWVAKSILICAAAMFFWGCQKEPEPDRQIKGTWDIQNSGAEYSKMQWTFDQKGQEVSGRNRDGTVLIDGWINGKVLNGKWEDRSSLMKGAIFIEILSPFKMKGQLGNGTERSVPQPFTGTRVIQ
jgi:hypothetical protein